MKKPTKNDFYALLSGVFCACLIISNVLAFKTFSFFGVTLPTAVLVFPIVYICNDAMTEIFGFKNARKIIFTAFAMNLVAVLAYSIAIALPYPVYFAGQEAFATVLGNSFRVLCASLTAYIVGSLTNAKVMDTMKGNSGLMSRCVLSTLAGEGLDAFIFISIAFIGTMPITDLAVMIIAQALFKTAYEAVVFPITKRVIEWAERLE